MKEMDYINATNLARLQLADDALRRIVPQGEQETLHHKTAVASVLWLLEHYYGKLK